MISRILKRTTLNFEMTCVTLEKPWDFQAGQYTSLTFEGTVFYFSIASNPFAETLELHIQNSALHPLDPAFAEFLNTAKQFDLSLPQGRAILNTDHRPLLLIAGGSGIAPLKSIAETAHILSPERPIHLYWGVRNVACFYRLPGISYIPVLSEEHVQGMRFGFVHDVVSREYKDLTPFDIYLAGPFPMALAARDAFLKQGARIESLFSDAFEFAL